MVVIASLCTEASPIVLREAFASGRPVVSTKIGDVPEIIRNGENGLMVEPYDSNALGSSIMKFLTEETLAARCAANALRYARDHFCFDRMMRAKVDVDLALIRSYVAPFKNEDESEPSSVAPVRSVELVSSD